MNVNFVVLYVNDADACAKFWTEKVGMIEKERQSAGDFEIPKVGFADQNFSFQLVPLAMMADNPFGLDLATPSIAFQVDDLEVMRDKLVAAGVEAAPIGDHSGTTSFAFSDNEGRWFAVTN